MYPVRLRPKHYIYDISNLSDLHDFTPQENIIKLMSPFLWLVVYLVCMLSTSGFFMSERIYHTRNT